MPLFNLTFALLISVSAFASNDYLVSRDRRPTMADLELYTTPRRDGKNPFAASGTTDGRFDEFQGQMADMIAQLEFLYPGATILALGRDAVVIGDFIDAFYRAHGQFDRVKRIDASGETFKESSPKLPEYIGQTVDYDKLTEPGYVLIDVSKFEFGVSQSSKILRILYDEFEKRGGKRADLIRKVNGYSLKELQFPVDADFDRDAFFGNIAHLIEARAFKVPPLIPSFTEKLTWGIWIYSHAWHESFGALRRDQHGKLVATVDDEERSPQTRRQILYDMWSLKEIASSEGFLERVKKSAKDLGYEFNVQSACEKATR